MRKSILLLLLALAACEQKPVHKVAATPQAGPAAPPVRKPGLWRQTVSSEGRSQLSRICLDAAVERRLTWWGTAGDCGTTEISARPQGGWRVSGACGTGSDGRTATTGVLTGDPASHYQVTAESRTTGAAAPLKNGARTVAIEAVWTGPCPADMKPGDVSLPQGLKVNLLAAG